MKTIVKELRTCLLYTSPGTSSMANGGRNIRRRIEAIARFKKYPAGMALASVCVTDVYKRQDYVSLSAAMPELEHDTGNVWTHILSLYREDAERLGCNNAQAG